jgi:predicted lysophospholipase L1 biosynthesis ABC-type transport system permease subunit
MVSASDAGDALRTLGAAAADEWRLRADWAPEQRPVTKVRASTQYAGSRLVVNQYGLDFADRPPDLGRVELRWGPFRLRVRARLLRDPDADARLNAHAEWLYADLKKLADSGVAEVGQAVADVYNALLDHAKKKAQTDEMVGILLTVTASEHPRVVQTLTGQLRVALGNA